MCPKVPATSEGGKKGGIHYLESLPLGALVPVGELVPSDRRVAVLGEVNAHETGVHVPRNKRTNRGKANISADQHPPAINLQSALGDHVGKSRGGDHGKPSTCCMQISACPVP